jgi:ankyrin repeat protein
MKQLLILFCLCLSNGILSQNVFDIARSGTKSQMETYLDLHPADLNIKSEHGASPFLLAAYRGNNEVALLLIEKGADLTYCYAEGAAIYALIYKNNLPLLDEILKRGVNPNDTCQFEQMGYPLHFALSLQKIEAVELLLKYNARTDILDPQQRTIPQLLKLYNNKNLNDLFEKYEK